MPLLITQHCKERYAERIMGKDERSEIAVYVAQHDEQITENVNHMVEYGTKLYTGSLKDKNIVNVILNGTWVVLTDKEEKKVITLYKIDFGIGDEFNKQFIEKMLVKLDASKSNLKDASERIQNQKKEYQKIIDDAQGQISEYKNYINKLSSQINGYKEVISSMDVEILQKENDVKDCIMELVCKKEF